MYIRELYAILEQDKKTRMTQKQKYFLLLILTVICGTIVFLQYQTQKSKHERLLTTGQKAKIIARPYTSWGVDYANYYFITAQGQKNEGNEKCGHDFNKYVNATAIYNPINPIEYDLSFNFDSYYPTWRIIFFFFIYLPTMIFVTYRFIKFGLTIYLKLKNQLTDNNFFVGQKNSI